MKRPNNKISKYNRHNATYIILIVASVIMLFPIFWMLSTSFKNMTDIFKMPPSFLPKPFDMSAYHKIWINYPFVNYFANSLIIVFASTILSIILSCLGGYGASRFHFLGKGSFLTFLLIVQMFPPIMMLIPFYVMLTNYGIINTHLGVILPYVSFAIPFCTWMMMGYFDTIPKSIDEAAYIDGCSSLKTFLRVVLPISVPGMAATGIYTFLRGWNEYMFALTLVSSEKMKSVPVGIAQLTSENRTLWNDMMAASAVAGIPIIIIFLFFQKYLISNLAAGAIKQ